LSAETSHSCPMMRAEVIDTYFMEHRARIIDIAAFLDRVERADTGGDAEDFREASFRQALSILSDGKPQRAARILSLLSDQTTEMAQSAEGMKGASGAPKPLAEADGGNA
jgi:hypothetical protein